MVKYALLSLGVAGLLMLGEGLAPQVTWPTGQQERLSCACRKISPLSKQL
jgi:hypothetical protein